MRASRLWALMLLPGGLAVGHVLGYEAAERTGASVPMAGHGYLGQLSLLAVPVTLAVLVRAFLAGARGELAPVRFASLAVQQTALYVVVEVVEHTADGIGPVDALTERSLVVGVAAQVLVAGTFALLVGGFRRLGVAVAATGPRPGGARRARWPWAVVTSLDARLLLDVVCVPRRGPPPVSILA